MRAGRGGKKPGDGGKGYVYLIARRFMLTASFGKITTVAARDRYSQVTIGAGGGKGNLGWSWYAQAGSKKLRWPR